MKQNEIRRIMNHVFSTIDCPHCGEIDLYKGEVKINSNSHLGLVFDIKCPECKTILKINGFLPGKSRVKTGVKSQINSQNIQQDIEKITKFRGNLIDLFK